MDAEELFSLVYVETARIVWACDFVPPTEEWQTVPGVKVCPQRDGIRQVTGLCEFVGDRNEAVLTFWVPTKFSVPSLLATIAHELAHAYSPVQSKTHTVLFAETLAFIAKRAWDITIKPNKDRPSITCYRVERHLRKRKARIENGRFVVDPRKPSGAGRKQSAEAVSGGGKGTGARKRRS